jgi:hypothetical protein
MFLNHYFCAMLAIYAIGVDAAGLEIRQGMFPSGRPYEIRVDPFVKI